MELGWVECTPGLEPATLTPNRPQWYPTVSLSGVAVIVPQHAFALPTYCTRASRAPEVPNTLLPRVARVVGLLGDRGDEEPSSEVIGPVSPHSDVTGAECTRRCHRLQLQLLRFTNTKEKTHAGLPACLRTLFSRKVVTHDKKIHSSLYYSPS